MRTLFVRVESARFAGGVFGGLSYPSMRTTIGANTTGSDRCAIFQMMVETRMRFVPVFILTGRPGGPSGISDLKFEI